jgi:membrane protein
MAIQPISWPALEDWRAVLVRTWKESGDDNVGLLAAGVAFYLFLAFVPLLASVVLTYGTHRRSDDRRRTYRVARAQPAPRGGGDHRRPAPGRLPGEKSGAHGFGLLIAIGIALYGASKGAGAVVTALNVAYEVKETRGFVARRRCPWR